MRSFKSRLNAPVIAPSPKHAPKRSEVLAPIDQFGNRSLLPFGRTAIS